MPATQHTSRTTILWSCLTSFVLTKVPDSFKWYDSKNYMTDATQSGFSAKVFEYILQGLKPGEYEIPPQEFAYFDVNSKTYKKIEYGLYKIN